MYVNERLAQRRTRDRHVTSPTPLRLSRLST